MHTSWTFILCHLTDYAANITFILNTLNPVLEMASLISYASESSNKDGNINIESGDILSMDVEFLQTPDWSIRRNMDVIPKARKHFLDVFLLLIPLLQTAISFEFKC